MAASPNQLRVSSRAMGRDDDSLQLNSAHLKAKAVGNDPVLLHLAIFSDFEYP